MCTPVGHTLLGAVIYKQNWLMKSLPSIIIWPFIFVFSILPDIDFLPGFFQGTPSKYHHQWTHSIGFSVIIGVFVMFMAAKLHLEQPIFWGLCAFVLVLGHVTLDFFTMDRSYPFGIQLFWPVSTSYLKSPVSLFRDINKSVQTADFIKSLFSVYNMGTVFLEIVIIGPFWIISKMVCMIKHRSRI